MNTNPNITVKAGDTIIDNDKRSGRREAVITSVDATHAHYNARSRRAKVRLDRIWTGTAPYPAAGWSLVSARGGI